MRKHRTFQTRRVAMAAGLAVFLCALGGGALFVRAKGDAAKAQELSGDSLGGADYDMLRALQFDGYEDMTVREFQTKVWEKTDTPQYREALERMSADTGFYEKKDDDMLAHFLFYVLEPLSAERWQTRDFGGCVQETFGESGQTAMVEYNCTLTISDADALTVCEYRETQDSITDGMAQLLKGRTAEELADADTMQPFLDELVERLREQWSTEKLEVAVEFCFQPLEIREEGERAETILPEDKEPRSFPNGTEEDYRSLLALKTPDYREMTVDAFNLRLLEWANGNYERMERIGEDTETNDFRVELDKEAREFVTRTVRFSGRENGEFVRSNYTGRAEEYPYGQESLPEKGGGSAWCDLYYLFTYHIEDKKTLTVGARDGMVGGMIDDVRAFWEQTSLDVLLHMKKADVVRILQGIAEKNSGDGLTIFVSADNVAFESYDERSAYDRLVSYCVKGYESLSIEEFHTLLCDSEEEFGRLLDANAAVAGMIPVEDQNYDFLMNTMSVSLSELYCEKFGEAYGVPATLVKQARPYGADADGETAYSFRFVGNIWISYTMDKERLTIEERNRTLQAMKDGLQAYVDELSEEALAGGDARKLLEKQSAKLAKMLSGDTMKLTCEVQSVEGNRDGEEIV